jgi:hypothetical protein
LPLPARPTTASAARPTASSQIEPGDRAAVADRDAEAGELKRHDGALL